VRCTPAKEEVMAVDVEDDKLVFYIDQPDEMGPTATQPPVFKLRKGTTNSLVRR